MKIMINQRRNMKLKRRKSTWKKKTSKSDTRGRKRRLTHSLNILTKERNRKLSINLIQGRNMLQGR